MERAKDQRYGRIAKGRTLPYGTLADASEELRVAYYYFGYRNDDDFPPLPEPPFEYDPEINPEEETAKVEMCRVVQEMLDSLTPRESKVLHMRFGIGCDERTLDEIGFSFDVTKERIRQIEAKAIRKLKHPSRRDLLRDAFDGCATEDRIEEWRAAQRRHEARMKKIHELQREIDKGTIPPENKNLAEAVVEGGPSHLMKKGQILGVLYPAKQSWVAHLKETNPVLYAALQARVIENVEKFG